MAPWSYSSRIQGIISRSENSSKARIRIFLANARFIEMGSAVIKNPHQTEE